MTSRSLLGGLACLVALAACDPVAPPEPAAPARVQAQTRALGEVVGSFPSDQERMVLVLTNLSRQAPRNECGDWTAEQGTAPKPPLVYSPIGNQAARFTSEHLATLGCFQHESCCVLGDVNGQVQCTANASCDSDQCGKQCTGGTPIADRYALLGMQTWSGENIARGQGSAREVWCGWMNSDGHRKNIYSAHTELGVGMFQATTGSCGRYWTQAFGRGSVPIPRIPAASAIYSPPNPQTAQATYFAANYYDPSARRPKRSAVVVNGHCIELTPAWGVPGNETFEAHFNAPDALSPGCQPYYFLFVDDNADRHTYPDRGSLFVAIGNGATCPEPYREAQLPADCESGPQDCTEGETRACYSGPEGTRDVGVCRGGVQTCQNGFWSGCDQQQLPTPEGCDGLDNDCDGEVDEGNPGGDSTCTVPGERGECKAGTRQCLGGGLVCVSTHAPQPEVCDGLDNDCDGVTDDGFPTVSCGVGQCFRMVPSCLNGVPQTCEPGTPGVEVEDSMDNDCDGQIDNGIDCRRPLADGGWQSGQARTCYSGLQPGPDGGIVAPQAPCQRGVQTCQADGGWSACAGEVLPSPEVCDGIDNDCNGKVDDNDELGWERCGTGTCTAYAQACRLGKPNACAPLSPGVESCDGADDDCDGTIDEGCLCREGNSYTCYSGPELTLDVGVCRAGVVSCNGGEWSTCEGEIAPRAESCNSLDDDCDGEVDDGCVPEPEVDAGTSQPPDAGDGSGGEAAGCGCRSSPGGGAWSLLALAALALAARRRTALP